jgi:hypothetical protein
MTDSDNGQDDQIQDFYWEEHRLCNLQGMRVIERRPGGDVAASELLDVFVEFVGVTTMIGPQGIKAGGVPYLRSADGRGGV